MQRYYLHESEPGRTYIYGAVVCARKLEIKTVLSSAHKSMTRECTHTISYLISMMYKKTNTYTERCRPHIHRAQVNHYYKTLSCHEAATASAAAVSV